MYILGISAFYHDSAAALIKDGKVICAIEEERLSRKKHDNNFPVKAVAYCLQTAHITVADVATIVYYEKPLKKFERILDAIMRSFPFTLRAFVTMLPEWLTLKIKIEAIIRKELGFSGEVLFSEHHRSHAAAAFYPSEFAEAAVLTVDGVGEYETTVLWNGKGSKIQKLASIQYPHSLGLWYSTFTAFLGFRVNFDEYKMMGMAAYGTPRYSDQVRKTIEQFEDSSYQLNLSYFAFQYGSKMWHQKLEKLLGVPRLPHATIEQRHYDIAASVQAVFEDVYLALINRAHQETGSSNICLGGGAALNALANGKILSKSPFEKNYIFGASGDSGAALGAALALSYHRNATTPRERLYDLRLGRAASEGEITNALELAQSNITYRTYSEAALIKTVVTALAAGKVIAWYDGRSEFGPRALGGRSILSRTDGAHSKERINTIKGRESFRPFGGIFLESELSHFVETTQQQNFPFMNVCCAMLPHQREKLQAITHADGSCRIQTISQTHGRIFTLLTAYHKETGLPCLLNTSFNSSDEPMVETPAEAIACFLTSSIDIIVVDSFLVSRL